MSDEQPEETLPTDRESPVGRPVIRGDPSLTGEHAERAVEFDPEDPERLALAAETVRAFADNEAGAADNVLMLRGAAACAALVRGEGSYKDAAARAGEGVTVSFIRKWSRVHDLPQSIRRHVARLSGTDRFHLAWAALDHEMTVRQVRSVASAVGEGTDIEAALADAGFALGELELRLPPEVYCELRRQASLEDRAPDGVSADALEAWLDNP